MAEYGIWLSFNNQQEGFQIPVNPSSIEMGDGNKGKTYDIVNLGEINVIKDRRLTQYSFSSIFPAQRYPFNSASILLEPKRYKDYLEKWMDSKRPIRFVFTGSTFNINTPVSIEDFQWKEVAGSIGDIEYTLKLKKYVFYAAQRVAVVQTESAVAGPALIKEAPARPNDRQPPKTYTMVAGDTLWAIAKRVFDDGSRWPEIQRLNNITDAQIKRLPIGKVLKLPDG